MNICPQCGVHVAEGLRACPQCSALLTPEDAGPILKRNEGCYRFFWIAFALLAIALLFLNKNFFALPLAASLSLGLTCMVYIFRWRPPPGTSTKEAVRTYILFGVGMVLAIIGAAASGCAVLLSEANY